MINNTNSSETNPIDKTKLKQYGKKSLAPLVNLVHKYKDQINPYMMALDKGLQGACNSFTANGQESLGAEKVVSGWFNEASTWFKGAQEKIHTEDPKDFLNYLEEQAKDKPGMMFATSYVAGLIFGRLGRHIVRIKAKSPDQASLLH